MNATLPRTDAIDDPDPDGQPIDLWPTKLLAVAIAIEPPVRDGIREAELERCLLNRTERNPIGEIVVTFERTTNRCTVELSQTHLDAIIRALR